MACFESGTVITLASREAITLPDVKGATLRVTRGVVWLTQENDRKDIVLRPGDNWVIEAGGDTVVEAQSDAMFCIVARGGARLNLPTQARRSARLWPALAAMLAPSPGHQVPYA
jgi:hypothetical protein